MNAPYGPAPALQNPGQTAASWSLFFGIISWLCLPFVGAAFAVGFGYSSLQSSKRHLTPACGTAIVGIVLGAIQLGIIGLAALASIAGAIHLQSIR